MIDHDVIRLLYPNVVTIRGEDAYDENEILVNYDKNAVQAKTEELKAEAEAKAEALIANRQSALDKLMALGLTEEEALALGVK